VPADRASEGFFGGSAAAFYAEDVVRALGDLAAARVEGQFSRASVDARR